jgi:hypothetical protein
MLEVVVVDPAGRHKHVLPNADVHEAIRSTKLLYPDWESIGLTLTRK